jgi:hypothetical protein
METITYGIQKITQEDIARLRAHVQITWKRACEHDKISPDSTFVVFSKRNPFEVQYNDRMTAYLAACRRYQEGR